MFRFRLLALALLLTAGALTSGCDVKTFIAPNACDLFVQLVDLHQTTSDGNAGIPDATVTVLDPLQTSSTDAGGWTMCFGTNANAQWAEATAKYLDALNQWRTSNVARIRLAHGTTYAKMYVSRRVTVGAPSLDGSTPTFTGFVVDSVVVTNVPPPDFPQYLLAGR